MIRIYKLAGSFAFLAALSLGAFGQTQPASPQEALNQYIADLQKSPDDRALREKIISLSLTMNPPPAITAEAKRNLVMGANFHKEAKDADGIELAVNAYKRALLIAPWWPDAYYDLALALVSAERYEEAIQNLELYLMTMPKPADAEEAQNLIYSIEAKKELAARENVAQAKKARDEAEAQREKERLNSFEGQWEVTRYEAERGGADSPVGEVVTITRQGDVFRANGPGRFFPNAAMHQSGRTLSGSWVPDADSLVDIFSNLPASVVRQAQGDVVFHPVMVLSGDGMTIEAEVDNYSVNGVRTTQFLMTSYRYTGVDHYTGFFKYSLRRVLSQSSPQQSVSPEGASAPTPPPADLPIKR